MNEVRPFQVIEAQTKLHEEGTDGFIRLPGPDTQPNAAPIDLQQGIRSSPHNGKPQNLARQAFLLSSPLLALALLPKILLLFVLLPVLCLAAFLPLLRILMPPVSELASEVLKQARLRSKLLQQLEDGFTWFKPFLLWGTFLSAPGAVCMMVAHSVGNLLKDNGTKPRSLCSVEEIGLSAEPQTPKTSTVTAVAPIDGTCAPTVRSIASDVLGPGLQTKELILKQNLPLHPDQAGNFLSSPAFTMTAVCTFALGIPGLLAGVTYDFTQVDRLIGYPSLDDRAFCFGLTYFYLYGLATCLTTLFFKAYFTFPLNFISREREITVSSSGIRKGPIKGWAKQALCFSDPDCWSQELKWGELRFAWIETHGVGGLSNLPTKWLTKTASLYKALNRMARLTDAVVEKLGPAVFLILSDRNNNERGPCRRLSINLWELNDEQKAAIYVSIQRCAPQVAMESTVRTALLGSDDVDTRMDKIIADGLTGTAPQLVSATGGRLEIGTSNGQTDLTVKELLPGDSRANSYLCETSSGAEYIVKEFLLVDSNHTTAETILSAAAWQKEVAILQEIDHPQMAKLHHAFISDNRAYLAVVKCFGKTLRELVQERGALAEKQVLYLAIQMCRQLQYLHSLPMPVVHRNFAPDSLVVDIDWKLYIPDFGAACFASAKKVGFQGHKAYAAPETFSGGVLPQSDLYSMGATLYFLLTGKDPLPISELHPIDKRLDMHHSLDAFIGRLTIPDADSRLDDVRWMEVELQHILKEIQDKENSALPLSA